MARSNLPVIGSEGNLSRYLQEIRKFPMLEQDEEFMLAKSWQEHEDSEAAHSDCALMRDVYRESALAL